MSRAIEIGDAVKLKSYPQSFMVAEVRQDGISVVWIDDYGQPHREKYPAEILNFVHPDAAEAKFKNKPAPKEDPVTLEIDEKNIPF